MTCGSNAKGEKRIVLARGTYTAQRLVCFDPDWEQRARQHIAEYEDHFTTCMFGFGVFERSWTMRGFENALMDAAAHPDFYEELVERITDHQMAILERVLELPLDGSARCK